MTTDNLLKSYLYNFHLPHTSQIWSCSIDCRESPTATVKTAILKEEASQNMKPFYCIRSCTRKQYVGMRASRFQTLHARSNQKLASARDAVISRANWLSLCPAERKFSKLTSSWRGRWLADPLVLRCCRSHQPRGSLYVYLFVRTLI